MINHARNLLINVPAETYQRQYVGEEYIPAEYRQVKLPSYLSAVYDVLFGSDPDRVFLNTRARELMALVHNTELSQYVYDLDPRVTYWPKSADFFYTIQNQIKAYKSQKGANGRIFITGNPQADNVRGRAFREFSVQIKEAETATIRTNTLPITATNVVAEIELFGAERKKTTTALVSNSGLTQNVDLVDTNLKVRFATSTTSVANLLMEDADAILTEDAYFISLESAAQFLPITMPGDETANDLIGTRWQIETLAKPAPVITTAMPTLEIMGEPLFLELFGVSNIQPFATFKNLWFDHPSAAYRLAGLTMAVIYRTEQLRKEQYGR